MSVRASMHDHIQKEAIEALERNRIAAMLAADVDALNELLHPDVQFGHTDGHTDDKDTYLAKFTSRAVRYVAADHRIVSVKVIENTALVSAHLILSAELASGYRQMEVVGLTVWITVGDSWKMIAHQPTSINV